MILEVDENPNCGEMQMLRFKELGAPRKLLRIRLYENHPEGEWCSITGWTGEAGGPLCPAYACPIEDSGIGVAHLIYGGNHGVRLKPADSQDPWSLENPAQWGLSHLILTSPVDLLFEDDPAK